MGVVYYTVMSAAKFDVGVYSDLTPLYTVEWGTSHSQTSVFPDHEDIMGTWWHGYAFEVYIHVWINVSEIPFCDGHRGLLKWLHLVCKTKLQITISNRFLTTLKWNGIRLNLTDSLRTDINMCFDVHALVHLRNYQRWYTMSKSIFIKVISCVLIILKHCLICLYQCIFYSSTLYTCTCLVLITYDNSMSITVSTDI